jgi:hypothetical protein
MVAEDFFWCRFERRLTVDLHAVLPVLFTGLRLAVMAGILVVAILGWIVNRLLIEADRRLIG